MNPTDSQHRILATHVGSLPRPAPLLDLMKERLAGNHDNDEAYDAAVHEAVANTVQMQIDDGVGITEYSATDEEYFHAVGAALRVEYKAIVDAGFLVQVDDPFMADVFVDPTLSKADQVRRADLHVEVINEALRGIAPERVRFH